MCYRCVWGLFASTRASAPSQLHALRHRPPPPPQYALIRGVAIAAVAVAAAAVYGAVLLVSASPAVALTTAVGVVSITTCLVGWVWMLNPPT